MNTGAHSAQRKTLVCERYAQRIYINNILTLSGQCAIEVFGSKKTYQALKGCYERNFNLFKQIYAFESFHSHSGSVNSLNEADRLREYERRLQSARKNGCDVGNITARTVDHWHRVGWYELFYRRYVAEHTHMHALTVRDIGGTATLQLPGLSNLETL